MAENGVNTGQNEGMEAVVRIIKPFLAYYVIYFITNVILTYLVNTISHKTGGVLETLLTEQEATVRAVIGGLAMLSGILPLFPAFRHEINCLDTKNSACVFHKHGENLNKIKKTLVTVTLAITSSLALNILFVLIRLTEVSETYDRVSAHQYGVVLPVGLFLYGVVSPFAEEVVFRGIIYNRLKAFFGKQPVGKPMVLSALLFGIYHGNIVQMLYGFLMGMLIACIYERYGGFLYAFLFHAAANTAVYVITGNPYLYERFITPQDGLVFMGISAFLLSYPIIFRFLRIKSVESKNK